MKKYVCVCVSSGPPMSPECVAYFFFADLTWLCCPYVCWQHQFLDIHVSLYFSRIMGEEERLCVLSWLLIASYARWLFYILFCQEIHVVKCIHWENRYCKDDDMKLISLDVETKGMIGTENCFWEGEFKTDSYYFWNKKCGR